MTPVARLADLRRQGFARGKKARAPINPKPWVACVACQNWHRAGSHTADRATRTVNLANERREKSARP